MRSKRGGRAARRAPASRLASLALLASLVALALPAAPAAANDFDAPFQVDADEVEYQADRDLYVARGHVVITQDDKVLRADRVYFSARTRQGVASGDVVIEQGGDVLRAPFVQFDVDTIQGVVFDGSLDSPAGGYRMQGREVRKTGDQSYEFEGGRFTTCRCPKPDQRDPWAIKAQKASLDIDGYGRARNSSLEILGVPVLWLPYAVYPLKRERQSGFLFPQIGTSGRSGGDITLPFFWAAADNVSVTLESQYQLRRGFKPAAIVEYVYGEDAEGELYGTYIHDQEIDPHTPSTPFSADRWGTTLRHRESLPWASGLAADVTAISDNQFPFDFSEFRRYSRNRFLRSVGWAGTHFGDAPGRFGFVASGESADDLQNPDDQDRDGYLLQRLPTAQLAALPAGVPGIPGLLVSGGVEAVHFAQYQNPADDFSRAIRVDEQFYDTGIDAIPDGQERDAAGNKVAFDQNRDDVATTQNGPEGNGLFEEGEPLADHGQRVVAHPRIAYPVHLGDVVELYPEAGYYGTFYSANLDGTDQRSLFTGRVDLRAKLRGAVTLPYFGKASHVAEPFVGWVGISSSDQDHNPLFVPTTAVPQRRLRLLEPDNWTLDPSDRVDEANNVIFGVNNRVWRGGGLLGDFALFSMYEFAEGQWGPAVAQGETPLPYNMWLRFQAVMDLDSVEFADGLADFGWSRHGNRLGVWYRYVRDIPRVFENFERNDRFQEFSDSFNRINQIGGNARWQISDSWSVTYQGSYSFDNNLSLINQFGLEYLSRCKCWAVRLEVNEDRARGFDWTLRYRLVGLGDQRDRLFTR